MIKKRIVDIADNLDNDALRRTNSIFYTDDYIILVRNIVKTDKMKVIKYSLYPSNTENWNTFNKYFFSKNI